MGQVPMLAEREMVRPAHDDVLKHLDLDELTRTYQFAGHLEVRLAGGQVATGMVL